MSSFPNPKAEWNSLSIYQLDQSISVLRVIGRYFYNCIQILIEYYASKQWRSWPDAAFCGVWSGSVLFACSPKQDARLISVTYKGGSRISWYGVQIYKGRFDLLILPDYQFFLIFRKFCMKIKWFCRSNPLWIYNWLNNFMRMYANSVDPESLSHDAGHYDKKMSCFENVMTCTRDSTFVLHDLTNLDSILALKFQWTFILIFSADDFQPVEIDIKRLPSVFPTSVIELKWS